MRIGIDISQIVFEGTGVARYVEELVKHLLRVDRQNDYILFGSSFRKKDTFSHFFQSLPEESKKKAKLISWRFPPKLLDILWNRFHIVPIEWLIGSVDIFWSSDWTQPPLLHAHGVTTIHDLAIYRFPESFDAHIV